MYSLFSKKAEFSPRHCRRGVLVHGEEGAEVVEFALSSMILLTFTFGLIGLCYVFFMYNGVAEAARATTRWASVRGTDCANPNITDGTCPLGSGGTSAASGATVQSAAQTFIAQHIPGGGQMTVTLQWCTSAGVCGTSNLGQGSTVQATVSCTFASVPFFTKSPLTVSSSSQSVIW